MGDWGGAPEGWIPPEERAEREAAAEAAAAMSERRALDDRRSTELVDAVVGGFAMLSDAILTAAGVSSHERDAFFARDEAPPSANVGYAPDYDPSRPASSSPAPVDDGIDDILDEPEPAAHECTPPAVDLARSYGTLWACGTCETSWVWMGDPGVPGRRAAWMRFGGVIAPPTPHECAPPAVPDMGTGVGPVEWVCPDCGRGWHWRGDLTPTTGHAIWHRLGTT